MQSSIGKFGLISAALVLMTIHASGCSSSDGSLFGNSADTNNDAGGASQNLGGDGGTCTAPAPGCACPTPGATVECGQTICRDGIRKCVKVSAEFSSWSICHSVSTGANCEGSGGASSSGGSSGTAGGSSSSSGGSRGSSGGSSGGSSSGGSSGFPFADSGWYDDGGWDQPDSGSTDCLCKPGTQRWCDTPVGCNWGTQTCNQNGEWGECKETNSRPSGCSQNPDPSFDPDCCAQSGECCQDQSGAGSTGACKCQ